MAIGVVKLARKQRFMCAIAFVALNITQSVLGLSITGWSVYICAAVSPTLYSEKSEVTFVFAVTGMYGTHVFFHNLIGIKICQKCYKQAYKKSTRSLLFLWILAGCNTMANMFLLILMVAKISKHIVRSIRHSLENGLRNYLKDPAWKYTIDRLQLKMKCCGINSYKDWYEFTWIDEYHVKVDADVVKELRTSTEMLHLPVTPWSCCSTDFPMQCLHDPLQQSESIHLWKEQPSAVLESIYNHGCLMLLRKPIETAFVGFIIITFFIFLVQFQTATILLSRILYTSCRNAEILNDPDGIAPGWIFGRGDCGWARGPGLAEMMGVMPSQSVSSSSKTRLKSLSKSSSKLPESSKMKQLLNKSSKASSTYGSEEEPVSSGDEEALMLK